MGIKNKSKIFFFTLFTFVMMIFSYAQEKEILSFQAGSLQTFVDSQKGNFSIYDKDQRNFDYMSLLFGGANNPNSFFSVTVDNTTHTLDQMSIGYPLGVTLNSQIDGMFYTDSGVIIEVAYFSLDLLNSGDFNSVGVILSLSNTSPTRPKDIGVKFVLDTDIGESQNDPLIYLPTGEKISNTYVFGNIPKYLFFGKKHTTDNHSTDTGFYLYPYVTSTTPSYMAVANWRRIFEQKISDDNTSFSYENNNIKDAGVALHFGEFSLKTNENVYVGFIISKQQGIIFPVLSEESISKGVFNKIRFEAEELLGKDPRRPYEQPYEFQQQKDFNRLNSLEQANETRSILHKMPSDSVWGYLYKLNWDIKQTSTTIDSQLYPPSNQHRR